MKKIFCIFAILITIGLPSCGLYKNRPMPFDKILWNSKDVTYDEKRYNMAIWFIENNWFEGKTKEIIINELINNKYDIRDKNIFENNILLFELKYTNEFMERWNIDYIPIPIAYLKIYFNEEEQVIRAEIIEGNKRIKIEKFKVIKYWNKNEQNDKNNEVRGNCT